VLTFPTVGKTWVYDVATGLWHERAGFKNGDYTRHRSNCQMNFNQDIIVGDFENGNIYALDLDVYSDGTGIQKWLRSWRALPQGTNNYKRTAQHTLQLDAETGVGLNLYPEYEVAEELTTQNGSNLVTTISNNPLITTIHTAAPGYYPQAMLRWSDDGGHTWSNEHWSSMGQIGNYGKRIFWRRLGMTVKLRDRVYEVSGTDPVKISIMAAELQLSPTRA